jgi:hypothetical protein
MRTPTLVALFTPLEARFNYAASVLRCLRREQLEAEVGTLITSHELDQLMSRRDGIIAYFDNLVKARGHDAVVLHSPEL